MWPSLLEMSKDESKKTLRALELEAYGSIVDALRAQGHFSSEKKKLLTEAASALCIPIERHKAEVRRAVNDERLSTIAENLVGPNTATDWAIEGRRMIPLLPRPRQNTLYSVIADECADYVSTDRETRASECANKAAEFPFTVEPASPEPSKTQVRSASPSGVLVFPSGTAIQMKREVEEDEEGRKKRRAPHGESARLGQSPSSPPAKVMVANQQQITMSSRTMPSPFPPGATPLKIALPTCGPRTPTSSVPTSSSKVIIVSSSPSILQKTLSVPMKTTPAKSTVMYSQSPNSAEGFKQRPKALQSTPLAKPRPNTIVVSQKTPIKTMTPGKHAMPMHTKIVVQQKAMQRGVQKPQHVMVQQKPGKQAVVTNVQVKTTQGFANVPMQLRPGAKPVQIKQDAGGQMKMVSISSGTKILPKPSQPMYVVTSSTTPLTMVTRTVPAGCPPRVMTVSTGAQGVKWNQSPMSSKSLQTMHMVTQPRRHDGGVVLVQKGGPGKTLIPHVGVVKDSPGMKGGVKGVKPVPTISSALAQSLQQLSSNTQSQTGANLILLDLTSQEKMQNNAALADFFQASGIIPDGDGKAVAIGMGGASNDADESDVKEEKEGVGKEETTTITSLSIEEAVEMLNRSDTPETRALLSQAGIQISDEIADSEEEEQLIEKSPDHQLSTNKMEGIEIRSEEGEISLESSFETDVPSTAPVAVTVSEPLPVPAVSAAPPTPVSLSSLPTLSTRPRSLDIFTTALASANINLDSFMEEEDDPELLPKEDIKSDTVKEDEATDSTADSSTDPLDLQLAELTGELGH